MFERFTNKARSVLVHAQDEARDMQHNFIGTEHILLGVIAANDDDVVKALSFYDFTLDDVREEIIQTIGPGDEEVTDRAPFTPRAKKVLELSLREALAMGHDHIGVPHILLGIMREGDGVAAQILIKLGVDYDRTRSWLGQTMGEGSSRGRRRGRGRGRQRGPEFVREPAPTRSDLALLGLMSAPESMAAKVLDSFGVTKEKVEAKIAEIGLENTSDAPPAKPTKVKLAKGVEIRVTDPELSKLVESGKLEELLAEIVKRAAKPEDQP